MRTEMADCALYAAPRQLAFGSFRTEITMGRQGAMILFRAQLAAVDAEIKAKHAQIASLAAAREAAEAQLKELHHRKRKIEEDHREASRRPDESAE
jgi:septal ring factor EnvC (AmiA/AmiB activator)